jgi:hypothetical protein
VSQVIAEDVRRLVEIEIGSGWELEYPHGVQLRRCLVVPRIERMRVGWDETTSLNLWVVLEEDPDEKAGYLVAYDEAEESFGLASRGSEGRHIFLGYYGSFIETLEAM